MVRLAVTVLTLYLALSLPSLLVILYLAHRAPTVKSPVRQDATGSTALTASRSWDPPELPPRFPARKGNGDLPDLPG